MNPDAVKEKLASRFGPDTIEVEMFRDQVIVNVPCQKIVNICQFLRDDPEMKFDFLS